MRVYGHLDREEWWQRDASRKLSPVTGTRYDLSWIERVGEMTRTMNGLKVLFVNLAAQPRRYWAFAALGAVGGAVLLGIPTAIIPNPLFERMIPAGPADYVFWVLTAFLLGLVGATYLVRDSGPRPIENQVAGGGILSVFAVGCPICNKAVVLALGVSGALTYFAPIQPLIGLVSAGLLLYALHVRLRAQSGVCPVR